MIINHDENSNDDDFKPINSRKKYPFDVMNAPGTNIVVEEQDMPHSGYRSVMVGAQRYAKEQNWKFSYSYSKKTKSLKIKRVA